MACGMLHAVAQKVRRLLLREVGPLQISASGITYISSLAVEPARAVVVITNESWYLALSALHCVWLQYHLQQLILRTVNVDCVQIRLNITDARRCAACMGCNHGMRQLKVFSLLLLAA